MKHYKAGIYGHTVTTGLLWAALVLVMFVFGALAAVLANQHPILPVAFLIMVVGGLVLLASPWLGLIGLVSLIPLQLLGKITEDGNITVPKLVLPLVLIAWFFRKLLARDRTVLTSFISHPILVTALLLMLACMPSFINARSLGNAYGFLIAKMLPMYFIMVLIADLTNTKERLKTLYLAAFCSSFLIGLFGIYEFVTAESILSTFGQDYNLVAGSGEQLTATKQESLSDMSSEWIRVASTYGDADFFGGHILLSLAFAFGLWTLTDSKWLKLVIVIYLAMSGLNMVATGSRAVLLAMLAFGGLYLLMVKFPGRSMLLGLMALAAIAILPFIEELMPQFRDGVSLDAYYEDPRYGFWTTALNMIRAEPLIGVGLGNFTNAYPVFMTAPTLHKPYMPHNVALGVLAETGIIGLLFFTLFGIATLWTLWTIFRSAPTVQYRMLGVYGLVAFISFTLFGLTSNTLDFEYAWITAGVVIALHRVSMGYYDQHSSEPTGVPPPSYRKVNRNETDK